MMAPGTPLELLVKEMAVGSRPASLSLDCWEHLVGALAAAVLVLGLAWALDQ